MEDGKHATNGKATNVPLLDFEAAPAGGGRVQLLVKRAGEAVHLDTVNYASAKDRRRLFDDLGALLKTDPEALFTAFNTAVVEAAMKAISMVEELAKQKGPTDDDKLQGRPLTITEHVPWETPVNLGDVLTEHFQLLKRHIVLSDEAAIACVLWAVATHFVDRFDTAPYLVLRSATKRCGKSRLARLLHKSIRRPLFVSSISAAALFRVVEAAAPSLVCDEFDAFIAHNEDVRGLLNVGVSRDESFIVRVCGDELKPMMFSVFGFKLLSGIGRLPPTVEDRAICVLLHRRLPTEPIERVTRRVLEHAHNIGRQYARAAADFGERIPIDADPPLPTCLNDRAADVWRPLACVADLAGPPWSENCRRAAAALSGETDKPTEDVAVRLLRDVLDKCAARATVTAGEICECLTGDRESEWATYSKGRPISPDAVGRLLARFDLTRKKDSSGKRHYSMAEIKSLAARYCPNLSAVSAVPNVTSCESTTYGTALAQTVSADGTCEKTKCRNVSPCESTTYGENGTYGTCIPGDSDDGQECEWVF